MNPPIIVHLKDSYDVRIDRQSKWGNPYIIGKHGTRSEVIKKYEIYLRSNKELIDEILSLDGKRLGCWCHPKKCHGDIIVKIFKELSSPNSELI